MNQLKQEENRAKCQEVLYYAAATITSHPMQKEHLRGVNNRRRRCKNGSLHSVQFISFKDCPSQGCPLPYRNYGSETLLSRHEAHLPRKASSVADWAPTPKGMTLHTTPISASIVGYCVHDVHTRTLGVCTCKKAGGMISS